MRTPQSNRGSLTAFGMTPSSGCVYPGYKHHEQWLEHLQANDQVLLGILTDAPDELLGLVGSLVEVIVEAAVLQQLSRRSLSRIQVGKDGVELGDRIVELFAEGWVHNCLAERAFPGVDLPEKVVGIFDGVVQ